MRKLTIALSLLLAALLLAACAQPTPTAPDSPIIPTVDIPHVTDLPTITATTTPTAVGPAPTGTPNAPPTATKEPPTTAFTVTLPLVTAGYTVTAPTPAPDVAIYDCGGEIAPMAWLTATFGAVSWEPDSLLALLACCGHGCPAIHVVHVQDRDGNPVQGATVILYWPDAPELPEALWNGIYHRGVYGPTNENGDIGFGLGRGAYYWPDRGETGPHVVWIGGESGLLSGIGMIAATDHYHLDSVWQVDGSKPMIDFGYSPCPVYLEDVPGRGEMYVIRCGE